MSFRLAFLGGLFSNGARFRQDLCSLGSWCWRNIMSELERHGHTVVARDLPGLGADKTPPAEVTLERYTQAVCGALLTEPQPVLLVGHSMGES